MMLAPTQLRKLTIVALVAVVSGCSTVERVILPRASAQRVVVQQDYIDFEQIQELNRFTRELEGATPSANAARLPQAQLEFSAQPSAVNRFKYAVLLAQSGENSANYETALSLFDDKAMAQLEYNTYWVVFAENIKGLVEIQLQLVKTNGRLLEERTGVLTENEKLKRELQSRVVQLDKVEAQLNALKSIEESILERDIGEESGKP